MRLVIRAGGADVRDPPSSWVAAENCSELCYWVMSWGGFANEWWLLPESPVAGYANPQYLKCMDGAGVAPLNGIRLQQASQFSTLALDPAVPVMNTTDWTACMRM